ncbi:MAG: hypothetical protein KIS67_25945 [Verrucomicrobiae bacterium]|nr:hypothetical protein [Verrucomicrobiae bacterium]
MRTTTEYWSPGELAPASATFLDHGGAGLLHSVREIVIARSGALPYLSGNI